MGAETHIGSSVSRLRQANSVSVWLDQELSHDGGANASDDGASKLDQAVHSLRQLSTSLAATRDQSRYEMEQLITSLVSTIPGMGVELSLMAENAKALDQHIRNLHSANGPADQILTSELQSESHAKQALAQIAKLSQTKAQMVAARHTLREAQSWTTLEAEFALMMSESRWQEAVQRLVNARKSLRMFEEVAIPSIGSMSIPHSSFSMQEKSELLLKLSANIEAKLVAELDRAFSAQDLPLIATLAGFFVQLERVDQTFMPTYMRVKSASVLQQWSASSTGTSNTSSHPSDTLVSRVSSLLQDVLALLRAEGSLAARVFSDATHVLQLLLSHVLTHLEPSLETSIAQAAQIADSQDFLAGLTDTWKRVEQYFRSFDQLLFSAPKTQDEEARPIHLTEQSSGQDWRRQLLAPFLPWLSESAQTEATVMRSQIDRTLQRQTPISAQVTQAIEMVKKAMRRSAELTDSVSLAVLLPPLEQLLASVLDDCRHKEETEGRSLLRDVANRINKSHAHLHSAGNGVGTSGSMVDERAEFLTQPEWDQFRSRTNKLNECRMALDAINKLDTAIARQLANVKVPQPTTEVEYDSPSRCVATSALNTDRLHDIIAKAQRRLEITSSTSSPTQSEVTLLAGVRKSLSVLAHTIQQAQLNLVLTPFTQADLVSYPHLAIWRSNKRPGLPANEYDLAMPKFSLSPTDHMARIGEAMLNLPRLFEGLADDALLFGLKLHRQQQRHAKEDGVATGSHTKHRKAFSMASIPATTMTTDQNDAIFADGSEDSEGDDEDDDDESDSDPTARILTRYLGALLRAFFAHFLYTTLPQLGSDSSDSADVRTTPPLSDIGASQLAADLEYLSNITSVLWSPSERVLAPYRQCMDLTETAAQRLLEHRRLGTTPDENDDINAIYTSLRDTTALEVIAKLRGWHAT